MDDTTRKNILFQGYITIHMYIFDISWSSYSQNRKKIVTFQGFFFRKVFGVWNFYANQLVFRVKQPYTMSFVEIPVGVVPDLADFIENPPLGWHLVVLILLEKELEMNRNFFWNFQKNLTTKKLRNMSIKK